MIGISWCWYYGWKVGDESSLMWMFPRLDDQMSGVDEDDKVWTVLEKLLALSKRRIFCHWRTNPRYDFIFSNDMVRRIEKGNMHVDMPVNPFFICLVIDHWTTNINQHLPSKLGNKDIEFVSVFWTQSRGLTPKRERAHTSGKRRCSQGLPKREFALTREDSPHVFRVWTLGSQVRNAPLTS